MVRFGSGSVVYFEVGDNGLDFGGNRLDVGEELSEDGELDALHVLRPHPTYRVLLRGAWRKANRFDRSRVPDRIVFAADGVTAGFRDGACELMARWNFLVSEGRVQFDAMLPENDCIAPYEPGDASSWVWSTPVVVGDRLRLSEHAFEQDGGPARQSWFTFGARRDLGIDVVGRFDGALGLDRETTIDFEITRTDADRVALVRLSALIRWNDDEEVGVLDIDLQGQQFPASNQVTTSGTLRPTRPASVPADAPARLIFELLTSEGEAYSVRGWFEVGL